MGEKYTPPGAADYKAPSAKELVELATGKVDETPAQMAHYEEFRGYLNDYLDTKIKPIDLASEESALLEEHDQEDITEDKLAGIDSALRAVRKLKQLQVSRRRESIIEELAKKQVAEVAEMDSNIGKIKNAEIRDAVYQLNEAVKSLARARFPKEHGFGMTEEETSQSRDRLSKMNIR